MAEVHPHAVRVRFAPSPTGMLHIGGLRTALYNYLFARKHGGHFVLRIEDTDRERFVLGAEEDVLDSLEWAGLTFDEGPRRGGPHDPYHQSRRSTVYRRYADELVEKGMAYYAFDTVEELDQMRQRQVDDSSSPAKYDAGTRHEMKNSLTLSPEETERRLASGEEHVIRMRVAPGEVIRFQDLIRGNITIDSDTIDDQVLIKSDGLPTYHLANVVDDHLMEITHVIRGEEWLPSTAKHVLLYRWLEWNIPEFAHLPLILSPAGGKLSKRSAEEQGVPVNVRQYREAGYEPEALINFLAFLGWNPGTEQEMFDLSELVDAFSLDRVGSSGVRLDIDKLKWYNEQYVRAFSTDELVRRARPYLESENIQSDELYLREVAELMQERISFTRDLAETCRYFFEDPTKYEEAAVKKRWKDDSADLLTEYAGRIEDAEPFTAATAEQELRTLAEERDAGAGRIIHPVRIAVSGVSFGPSLFNMMEVLGRDKCVARIRRAVDTLG